MPTDEETVLRWLGDWERLINLGHRTAARSMFAPDVVGFGTLAEATAGMDDLDARQWHPVWPRIRDFAFDPPERLQIAGDLAAVAVRWRSEGLAADGGSFRRRGRATLVLQREGDRWLCSHSHLSMTPGTSALA